MNETFSCSAAAATAAEAPAQLSARAACLGLALLLVLDLLLCYARGTWRNYLCMLLCLFVHLARCAALLYYACIFYGFKHVLVSVLALLLIGENPGASVQKFFSRLQLYSSDTLAAAR